MNYDGDTNTLSPVVLANAAPLTTTMQLMWRNTNRPLGERLGERVEILDQMEKYNEGLASWLYNAVGTSSAKDRRDNALDYQFAAETALDDARFLGDRYRRSRAFKAKKAAEAAIAQAESSMETAARTAETMRLRFSKALTFLNAKGFQLNTKPPFHVLPGLDLREDIHLEILSSGRDKVRSQHE